MEGLRFTKFKSEFVFLFLKQKSMTKVEMEVSERTCGRLHMKFLRSHVIILENLFEIYCQIYIG